MGLRKTIRVKRGEGELRRLRQKAVVQGLALLRTYVDEFDELVGVCEDQSVCRMIGDPHGPSDRKTRWGCNCGQCRQGFVPARQGLRFPGFGGRP